MTYFFVILTILMGGLSLIQLWTPVVSAENFVKILISYIIIMFIASVGVFIVSHYKEQKRLKEKNLLG